MKHTLITDEYVEIINSAINEVEAFWDEDAASNYCPEASITCDFLQVAQKDLKTVTKEKIKIDFIESSEGYDGFLIQKEMFEFRYEELLNWKHDFANGFDENLSIFKQEISEYFDKCNFVYEKYANEDMYRIETAYVTLCLNIISIKRDLVNLLQEFEKLGKIYLSSISQIPQNTQIASIDNEKSSKNKDFTTKRQVLAMYYLLNEFDGKTKQIDRTVKARFVEFLTGKNYDSIYRALQDPFKALENTKNASAKHDIKYVVNQFNELGLTEISKKINADMSI